MASDSETGSDLSHSENDKINELMESMEIQPKRGRGRPPNPPKVYKKPGRKPGESTKKQQENLAKGREIRAAKLAAIRREKALAELEKQNEILKNPPPPPPKKKKLRYVESSSESEEEEVVYVKKPKKSKKKPKKVIKYVEKSESESDESEEEAPPPKPKKEPKKPKTETEEEEAPPPRRLFFV